MKVYLQVQIWPQILEHQYICRGRMTFIMCLKIMLLFRNYLNLDFYVFVLNSNSVIQRKFHFKIKQAVTLRYLQPNPFDVVPSIYFLTFLSFQIIKSLNIYSINFKTITIQNRLFKCLNIYVNRIMHWKF